MKRGILTAIYVVMLELVCFVGPAVWMERKGVAFNYSVRDWVAF